MKITLTVDGESIDLMLGSSPSINLHTYTEHEFRAVCEALAELPGDAETKLESVGSTVWFRRTWAVPEQESGSRRFVFTVYAPDLVGNGPAPRPHPNEVAAREALAGVLS